MFKTPYSNHSSALTREGHLRSSRHGVKSRAAQSVLRLAVVTVLCIYFTKKRK